MSDGTPAQAPQAGAHQVGAHQVGALQVGWICVDCHDPQALAAWWQRLLGGSTSVDEDGDVHLDGGPVPLMFLAVPEPKTGKNRVHLDLRVDDYDEAVDRALALGATGADDVYAGDRWRVLRDPEGNEFCIIRPPPSAGAG